MANASIPANGRGTAVLAVDDNPKNLLAMEVMLAPLELSVVCARSGREALTQLLAHDFAVILLDVCMPDMDGFELAILIRQHDRFRHLPIIFVTAYAETDEQVKQAYALGAVDFLLKPLVPEIVRAKVGAFVDLSRERARAIERVRMVDDLRRRTDELGRADRRKDEFLAVLGHELRNPLAPILYALELMKSCPPGEAGFERLRRTAEEQARAMSRLVDDLLDISRINEGKIQLERGPTSVSTVLDRAVETSTPLMLERGHELDVIRMDPDLEIEADSVRLVQVVANLLNNAVRYTSPGGKIRLAAQREGDVLRISVTDNGRGITAEALPRIFDAFVQSSATSGQPGLGLGLAVVKHLVELHGGRVAAASAGPGQGSEFSIRIPIVGIAARKVGPADLSVDHPMRSLQILLVDDDRDNRELLQLVLEDLGHHVQIAADGEAGIAELAVAKVDVGIVDIGLPDMSGYDLSRRLAEHRELRPPWLVALTGFGTLEDRARALASGFDDHLVKPATPDALHRVLNDASRHSQPVIRPTAA